MGRGHKTVNSHSSMHCCGCSYILFCYDRVKPNRPANDPVSCRICDFPPHQSLPLTREVAKIFDFCRRERKGVSPSVSFADSSLIRGSLGLSNPNAEHENPACSRSHRSDPLLYEARRAADSARLFDMLKSVGKILKKRSCCSTISLLNEGRAAACRGSGK